jgi:hypothetical protein
MAPAGVAAGVASAAVVGPPQGRSGLAVSGPAISLKPLPRSVLLWRARQRSRAFGVTVAAGRWVAGSLADCSVLKHTAETGGSCAIPNSKLQRSAPEQGRTCAHHGPSEPAQPPQPEWRHWYWLQHFPFSDGGPIGPQYLKRQWYILS